MVSPQMENAPLMPAQLPFSGWHLAPYPVCSARLLTRGSEKQQHLFHAADVWQTIPGLYEKRKRKIKNKNKNLLNYKGSPSLLI